MSLLGRNFLIKTIKRVKNGKIINVQTVVTNIVLRTTILFYNRKRDTGGRNYYFKCINEHERTCFYVNVFMYVFLCLNQVTRNTNYIIIKVYVSLKKLVHKLAIAILSPLFSIFIYLLLGKVILETASSTF